MTLDEMGWKRITINLEPEMHALAKARAKTRRQSVAAYFASLLDDDVKKHQFGISPALEAVKKATEEAMASNPASPDPQSSPKKPSQSARK
jgi:hypothetical protein